MVDISQPQICIIGDLRVECRVWLADLVFTSLRGDTVVEAARIASANGSMAT